MDRLAIRAVSFFTSSLLTLKCCNPECLDTTGYFGSDFFQMESVIFLCFFPFTTDENATMRNFFSHLTIYTYKGGIYHLCWLLCLFNFSYTKRFCVSASWFQQVSGFVQYQVVTFKIIYVLAFSFESLNIYHITVKLLCAFFVSMTFSGLLSTFRKSSNLFFHAAHIEMNKNRNDEHGFCTYSLKMYNGATVRHFYHLSVILR